MGTFEQPHREAGVLGVLIGCRDISDRQARRVVIGNGQGPGGICDGGIGGIRQGQGDGLVVLISTVGQNRDGKGLAGLAGGES